MNKYESVIIVNPNVDEAGLKTLQEKFTGLINKCGKVEAVENMGKKKLFKCIKCSLLSAKESHWFAVNPGN